MFRFSIVLGHCVTQSLPCKTAVNTVCTCVSMSACAAVDRDSEKQVGRKHSQQIAAPTGIGVTALLCWACNCF